MMRLVLMAMVVMLHVLQLKNALPVSGNTPDAFRVAGMALESLCIIAVNCFVMMSGYLHAHSRFNRRRFLELVAIVLFYGCGMCLLSYACGLQTEGGLFFLVQRMLPVSSNHYWFMSCYLILYLVMPFLNTGAKALEENTFRWRLMALLFFSCFLKSVIPVNLVTDDMGYGLQWFLCLYLTGLYLRLHVLQHPDAEPEGNTLFVSAQRHAGVVYPVCAVLVCVMACALSAFNAGTGKLAWYASVPFHYNFVLNYVGALAFLLWFFKRRIGSGTFSSWCARLAPHALGVYLFQAHPAWMARFVEGLSRVTGEASPDNVPLALLRIALTVIVLFAAGILIDMIRGALFALFSGKASGKGNDR